MRWLLASLLLTCRLAWAACPGTGIAAEDVAGTCRPVPPEQATMGALEVARAALSDVTFAPPPTSESVFLAWLPYVDPLGQPPVTNYRIYYGPALNSVAFIRIVPATQTQAA